MPFDEKIGVTVMLSLLGIGLLFVRGSGRWRFHDINPIRILLAKQDGTLRPLVKPILWALMCIAIAAIWLIIETE